MTEDPERKQRATDPESHAGREQTPGVGRRWQRVAYQRRTPPPAWRGVSQMTEGGAGQEAGLPVKPEQQQAEFERRFSPRVLWAGVSPSPQQSSRNPSERGEDQPGRRVIEMPLCEPGDHFASLVFSNVFSGVAWEGGTRCDVGKVEYHRTVEAHRLFVHQRQRTKVLTLLSLE